MQGKEQNQRGAVTLFMAIMMLVAVTLVVVYGANTGVLEHRTFANDYRARQAAGAAQAGVETALAQLSKLDLRAQDADGDGNFAGNIAATQMQIADANGNNRTIGSYSIAYTASNNYERVAVSATGTSGDGSATKLLAQTLTFAPFIRHEPLSALVARDGVTINNSVSITNTVSDIAIVAGGIINGANPPANITVSANAGDGFYQDANLASPALFENTFAASKTNIRGFSRRIDCSASCNNTPAALTAENGVVFWVNGDVILNGNTTLGTAAAPVILVVENGNLTLGSNNVTINGIVYVIGNWDNGNGRGTINGAAIVEGAFTANGNLNITYDATVMDNLNAWVGTYVPVPGSWREL